MKSVAIIGGGESGTAAALLAHKKGISAFVSDYGTIAEQYKEELENHNIPFEEKGHDLEKILKADVIVKSPGIPENSEVMRYFRLRHKKIISEIEFASRFYDGHIIGITGSNGKTTTTKLCYHILKHSQFNIGMGGNVGISFARLLLSNEEFDWVVLELSSFQLDDIQDFEVDVAVVLNITPDHLDRYDYNFDNYVAAKWNLPLHAKNTGYAILNSDDAAIRNKIKDSPLDVDVVWIEGDGGEVLISTETSAPFEMQLRGEHNMFNASVCVTIARNLEMSDAEIQKALLGFKSVAHRMEPVASFQDVEFINDSKATNIDSSRVALQSMTKPTVWIAGGTDKGNDYRSIESLVREKAVAIVCLTKDDSNLRAVFGDYGERIHTTHDVRHAIRWAMNQIERGTILLSPACASFDLFKNYEHRGDSFKSAVHELLNESN